MKSFATFKKQSLKNKTVKKYYDALQGEYERIKKSEIKIRPSKGREPAADLRASRRSV